MCNKAFAYYRIWHLKSPWTIFNLSRKKGKNCVAEELNMVPSSKYMKNSKQKLKKWRVGNVLMVNLNQILLNFFLSPPNLFTAAERITDSCLPFKKQLCQWRKITTFGNIYLLVIFLDRQIVSSEHSSNMRTETPSWLDGILQRLVPESCYEKPTGTHRAWKEL